MPSKFKIKKLAWSKQNEHIKAYLNLTSAAIIPRTQNKMNSYSAKFFNYFEILSLDFSNIYFWFVENEK